MGEKRSYGQYCTVARALDVVGERWTLLLVRELSTGPKRFKDLLEGLPGIGTNLLANRLKTLEGEGVVGLLLAVRSPETALRTLSEWGVVREVVEQDAEVTERGLRGDPLPEPAEEEEVLERV